MSLIGALLVILLASTSTECLAFGGITIPASSAGISRHHSHRSSSLSSSWGRWRDDTVGTSVPCRRHSAFALKRHNWRRGAATSDANEDSDAKEDEDSSISDRIQYMATFMGSKMGRVALENINRIRKENIATRKQEQEKQKVVVDVEIVQTPESPESEADSGDDDNEISPVVVNKKNDDDNETSSSPAVKEDDHDGDAGDVPCSNDTDDVETSTPPIPDADIAVAHEVSSSDAVDNDLESSKEKTEEENDTTAESLREADDDVSSAATTESTESPVVEIDDGDDLDVVDDNKVEETDSTPDIVGVEAAKADKGSVDDEADHPSEETNADDGGYKTDDATKSSLEDQAFAILKDLDMVDSYVSDDDEDDDNRKSSGSLLEKEEAAEAKISTEEKQIVDAESEDKSPKEGGAAGSARKDGSKEEEKDTADKEQESAVEEEEDLKETKEPISTEEARGKEESNHTDSGATDKKEESSAEEPDDKPSTKASSDVGVVSVPIPPTVALDLGRELEVQQAGVKPLTSTYSENVLNRIESGDFSTDEDASP